MNLKALQSQISNVHSVVQRNANLAINQSLTMRNWLIGHYIVEYEQNGSDRQKYGSKILQILAADAVKKNIKGLSISNLKNYRQFYIYYPTIGLLVSEQFKITPSNSISQTPSVQFKKGNQFSISQTPSVQLKTSNDELSVEPDILINNLSFSHFVELFRVEDSLQKTFYELQTIKENWSVQDLKRAINTNLYARTGLSKNKVGIIKKLKKEVTIKIKFNYSIKENSIYFYRIKLVA